MSDIKQKVKNIVNNKILKKDIRFKDDIIYKALKILLGDNYYSYNFEQLSIFDINENQKVSKKSYQEELFSLNEKGKYQKQNGIYYTKDDIVKVIVNNAIKLKKVDDIEKDFISSICNFDDILNYTIFDPTCGTGEFLLNSFDIKLDCIKNDICDLLVLDICSTLFGNDIDLESIDICKIRIFFKVIEIIQKEENVLELAKILNANFFNLDFIKDSKKIKNKFDIIVGNPPYVEYGKYKSKNNYELKNGFGNVYADVLLNGLELLKDDGICGYIIPISYVATPRMKQIRKIIYEKTSSQIIMNFADRPDCLFTNVHQKLSIILFKKSKGKKQIFSSSYKYWYKDQRKDLFNDIKIIEQNEYIQNNDLLDEFIPKIGNEIEKSIFSKVFTKENNNILDMQDKTKKEIFLNARAMFWIKAFSFNPGSNEYKKLYFDDDIYYFILCLLNSNLFWLFWIIISDCWHITSKELKHFKVVKNDNCNFKDLYLKLEQELEKTKKYIGSKQTPYEYKHKYCKKIIDEIDENICKAYGLNEIEINYCKCFAKEYRMSKEDD